MTKISSAANDTCGQCGHKLHVHAHDGCLFTFGMKDSIRCGCTVRGDAQAVREMLPGGRFAPESREQQPPTSTPPSVSVPVPSSPPTFMERRNAGRRRIATLVPLGAMESIANAGEIGLVKYFQDSFRDNGAYPLSFTMDSAARHIMHRIGGEKYDPDGSAYLGRPIDHLDMAIWNLSAACEALRVYGARNDDLWYGPGSAIKPGDKPHTAEYRERMAIQRLLDQLRKMGQQRRDDDPKHQARINDLIAKLETQLEEGDTP